MQSSWDKYKAEEASRERYAKVVVIACLMGAMLTVQVVHYVTHISVPAIVTSVIVGFPVIAGFIAGLTSTKDT